MKKQVTIELPGIKAVSRNETTGHWFRYSAQLTKAENWMCTYGKAKEVRFDKPVDVIISAYYNTTGRSQAADTPNIDDKIFTDILIRYKSSKKFGRIERPVWFIEDDSPKYLRRVIKQSIPSNHYKVVIEIKEVDGD